MLKGIVACVVLFLMCGTGALADLANPSTLIIKETSPSLFVVELTLPVVQGRVAKARPVLPDVCVIEGDAEEKGDSLKVVRTWTVACDPNDLVDTTVGVHGLLGTSMTVQLTLELLDGRKYVSQLRPTQAYYLVPPSPTMRNMVVDVGGAALRQVLRHPELALLLLLCVFYGVSLPVLFASTSAFAVSMALGQWLKTENWIGVSTFLPVILTVLLGLAMALSIIRGKTPLRQSKWRVYSTLMALSGLLYGGSGLPVKMVLSRSEQNLAFIFSAMGTMAGLALVILCATQLRAVVNEFHQGMRERLRFWIAYLGGVAVCGIGLYLGTGPLFVGGVTPAIPLVSLLLPIVLGAWCGAQTTALRSISPVTVGAMVILGAALSLRGMELPQTTMVVYGTLALVGLLLFWPVRWPGWVVLLTVAVTALYHGAYAGAVLLESVALPVAQTTALIALFLFLFIITQHSAEQRSSGRLRPRLFGLTTAVLAIIWRIAEYRVWMDGDVAVEATIGLVRLPVLSMSLVIAAFLMWPRKRRFQPSTTKRVMPIHWALVFIALFTVSVAGISVRNPLHTPRAPTAEEAQPVLAMLLTDTYFAFNLPDEDAAFDRLAINLSDELVPGVYLDSRRRLTAGTREGAEVTVKDVSVISVEAPSGFDSGEGSFTYPCKWIVTARVRHWQHIHDRQNIYIGTLTIRVENNRWKISNLELLSEEREIVSWKSS